MTSYKFEAIAVAIIAMGMFLAGIKDAKEITAILKVAGGCLAFFLVFYLFFRRQSVPYELDWTVDNTALAYDPEYGCVLVAAANTHKIEGRDRHVKGNLPANILFYDYGDKYNNLYVVDFYHKFGVSWDPANGRHAHSVEYVRDSGGFHWVYFKEPMEVVPRGAGKNWSGSLADTMAGYSYKNYVLPKGTRPDISAPGVKKQHPDGSWHDD